MAIPSGRRQSPKARKVLEAALALSVATFCTAAQPRKYQVQATPAPTIGTPATTARQIAAEVADHEIKFLTFGPPFVRYRMHTVDAKGEQIRDVVQSKDGAVARLISRDGRALTPEEDAAERTRLQAMIDAPETYMKHAKGDSTGKRTAQDVIRLMPDAMLFTFVEGQPQRARHSGDPEMVIDFKPDPAWSPPTIASGAITGLQGRMWVDAKTHTLTAIDATIFRGVNVGLLLAHIFPGGTLSLEQAEEVPNKWFFTHFVEHLTLRVLFKTIHENSDVTSSNFEAINPMSYQDAVHLLLTPSPGR